MLEEENHFNKVHTFVWKKIIQLHKCHELTDVIKEEQIARKKLYETIEVSNELFNLTRFIIEAINCEA